MTSARGGHGRGKWALCVAVCALLMTGCSLEELQPGDYAFRADEILRDDCGLLADGDALWDGRVRVSGEVVWVDYSLFGMELVGQYKSDGAGFLVDGSAANVEAPAEGGTCRFESVSLSVDAEISAPTSFGGTLRLRTTAGPDARCTCELWTRFTAQRQGS